MKYGYSEFRKQVKLNQNSSNPFLFIRVALKRGNLNDNKVQIYHISVEIIIVQFNIFRSTCKLRPKPLLFNIVTVFLTNFVD